MENKVKKRVWELDAFRGIFIIGMVAVHTVYDLVYMFGASFDPGVLYEIAIKYGALLFIVLSGISVTFGTKHLKRGFIVLGFGLVISLAMLVLDTLVGGFGMVYFGILHLLGTCMLLYTVFKRLPVWALCICAALALVLGYYFKTVTVEFTPLVVLGFDSYRYAAADHFPILPNLGWFIIGIILGKTLYKDKKSLLPEAISKNLLVKFFMLCGRQSLLIYVLHQPIVYAILYIIFALR